MKTKGNEVQYLEDLATSYWNSEVLFSAVQLDIFFNLQEPISLHNICEIYGCNMDFMKRFLDVLIALDLIKELNEKYSNCEIANEYLIRDREMYQGDSILWRRELKKQWECLTETIMKGKRIHYIPEDSEKELMKRNQKYISAMDAILKEKAREIVSMFKDIKLEGKILDVGAGSGSFSIEFLKKFPQMNACLMDLENVIRIDMERYEGLRSIQYHMGNILEEWTVKGQYKIIILSNILHAYSEPEVRHILKQAVQHISQGGYMIIHDFFFEHSTLKARLSDLNMMINTYNGKVYYGKWICECLEDLGLASSELISLEGDTSVIFASKESKSLKPLYIEREV